VKQSGVIAIVLAGVLAVQPVAEPRAEVAAGVSLSWGWPGYGSYPLYRDGLYGYGWIGPRGGCGAGACIDDPYLRRAIRRELELHEHVRDLEERSRRGYPPEGTLLYGERRDLPPPTPESDVQPDYRGSGEIRPEFSGAGQPRRDSAAPR